MFPITNPSRMADIRMRRRRALLLLGGIALVFIIVVDHHQHAISKTGSNGHNDFNVDLGNLAINSASVPATEINSVLQRIPFVGKLGWMVNGAALPTGHRDAHAISATGGALSIDIPCVGDVSVVPAPDLRNTVFVAPADGTSASDYGLALNGGDVISLTSSCMHGRPDIVIQAPPAMKFTMVQFGGTDLRMGAFTGPITLSQNGDGDMVIDQAGSLEVSMAGSGDLSVGSLKGDLILQQNGSGDITINHAEANKIAADMHGSGDLGIAAGTIGTLTVVMQGSGDLSSNAVIGNATVRAGQESDVTLPNVKGKLDRNSVED